MAIPSKISGAGPNDATKCIKVIFSQTLSTAPKIEAWDNAGTFPGKDSSGSTTAKEIFTGTVNNGYIPCLAAWSGGSESDGIKPGKTDWHPISATAGSANPNLLKGTTNFVTCTNTPSATGNIVFNVSLKIADDMTVPSTTSMAHLIQVRYTYTGTAPTLTFYYNDGGDDTTPVWLTFAPGTDGIRFCDTGTIAGTYVLTLAGTGDSKTAPEVWVTK